jgi:hypothetical protein
MRGDAARMAGIQATAEIIGDNLQSGYRRDSGMSVLRTGAAREGVHDLRGHDAMLKGFRVKASS